MKYLSVCSGIEAATVAWHPLGWEPVAFAEIDKFPSAVLAHRWPSVPNLGDFTAIEATHVGRPIDLMVGGTPCQSFSVAGLRGGLADDRGNLALKFLKLAQRLRPGWLVWENVPGVLSSNGGRDFGSILGGLVELGYGFAYRVLDAQHFGVPQRRRRVFVVGHLGDWRRAAAVLFERHSLQGHPAPRRQAGEGLAPTIASRPTGGGGLGTDFDCDGGLIARAVSASNQGHRHDPSADNYVSVSPTLRSGGNRTGGDRPPGTDVDTADSLIVARCVTARHGMRYDGETETFVPVMASGCEGSNGAGIGLNGDPMFALDTHGAHAIAFQSRASHHNSMNPHVVAPSLDKGKAGGVACFDERNVTSKANRTRVEFGRPANTLHEAPQAIIGPAVRRLMPVECERLQGFPDGYTAIPYRGKPAADGPRYKALGNSMAVPCMRWIGERIQQVEVFP